MYCRNLGVSDSYRKWPAIPVSATSSYLIIIMECRCIERHARRRLILIFLICKAIGPGSAQKLAVDLSPILQDFQLCNVNIMLLDPGITAKPLIDFPISISTYPYKYQRLNATLIPIDFGATLSKRVFCAVQVLLVQSYNILMEQKAFGIKARAPVLPNPVCSSMEDPTDCLVLIVGVSQESWTQFVDESHDNFSSRKLTSFEVMEGLLRYHFFVIFANPLLKDEHVFGQDREVELGGWEYLCRACLLRNGRSTVSSVTMLKCSSVYVYVANRVPKRQSICLSICCLPACLSDILPLCTCEIQMHRVTCKLHLLH